MSVTVENPDGSQTDVLVKDEGNGVFTITWTPEMVGKHKVVVKFGGKEVPGSPFAVSALMKVSYKHLYFHSTLSTVIKVIKHATNAFGCVFDVSVFQEGSKPRCFMQQYT